MWTYELYEIFSKAVFLINQLYANFHWVIHTTCVLTFCSYEQNFGRTAGRMRSLARRISVRTFLSPTNQSFNITIVERKVVRLSGCIRREVVQRFVRTFVRGRRRRRGRGRGRINMNLP